MVGKSFIDLGFHFGVCCCDFDLDEAVGLLDLDDDDDGGGGSNDP